MKIRAWIISAFALLLLPLALHRPDAELIFAILFMAGVGIVSFMLTGRTKKQQQAYEAYLQNVMDDECRQFTMLEEELRRKLAAGDVRLIVEWWEEDTPFINENAHMEFFFTDGTSIDFVLHLPTAKRLCALLAEYGIAWEWKMKIHFDSCILYPPSLAGYQLYTSDGKLRGDIDSKLCLSSPPGQESTTSSGSAAVPCKQVRDHHHQASQDKW